MEKLKLVEKAYKLKNELIDEGYWLSDKIVYTDTIGKAKQKILGDIKYDDYKLKYTKEPITFLNIPIKRDPESDKFEFEGQSLQKWRIEQIKNERIRLEDLNKILDDESIKYCYIRKGSYYRPGSCGYTDFQYRAGVFTKEEAVSDAKSCSELWIIPIDIEEHNKMIMNEINELETRILN